MVKIVIYELVFLFFAIVLFLIPDVFSMPHWYHEKLEIINCTLIGLVGGILYCLRGIYKSKSVYKNWDESWHIWYYLRPVTSAMSGFISYIILNAGLLTLDATTGDTDFGFFAFAFIAGYNVDNFLKKLEEVAKTVWGIDKSRSSDNN